MCKTKVQINLYCDEIKKCKHEKNKTKQWNYIIFQIGIEHIKGNGDPTSIYMAFEI